MGVIIGVRRLTAAAAGAILVGTFGVQLVRVDGFSMAPTLEDDDRLIVDRFVYQLGDPRPGDIVTLYYPRDPTRLFVKRVIATEGDTVSIENGSVRVNGVRLRDDYVSPGFRSDDNWGPERISEGYEFVLGDHRNDSSDSRDWGLVPKRYIVGKVKVRWWPLYGVRTF